MTQEEHAALAASPVGQPVAWMYERGEDGFVCCTKDPSPHPDWTETPLYPAATVNALVEALAWYGERAKEIQSRRGSWDVAELAARELKMDGGDRANKALALVGGVSS